ncbi:hypothetical protein [Helicobacter equorum]|uniref:hypothetical protein n=1 Tax=Helicobacter equorum TaxID=361872 RepID=UPI000CF0C934|nr:hypothetical protein [Helicobacter equorum]
MNTLPYTITNITHDRDLGLVGLQTPIGTLWVFVLITPHTRCTLAMGTSGLAYFKPTQVLLARKDSHLYTQNCFQSRIQHITKDTILSLISLECGISALVATQDTEAFAIGDLCAWYINPSDILLESLQSSDETQSIQTIDSMPQTPHN